MYNKGVKLGSLQSNLGLKFRVGRVETRRQRREGQRDQAWLTYLDPHPSVAEMLVVLTKGELLSSRDAKPKDGAGRHQHHAGLPYPPGQAVMGRRLWKDAGDAAGVWAMAM